MNISTHDFYSKSTKCVGDLYLPKSNDEISENENFPIIIMAHGFGGERTASLSPFAKRFCHLGFAVFLFDYRYFGDSEGVPRQLISPWKQLSDWRAAIAYVRELKCINYDQLFLWGTSFSGGHVIELAAENHNIKGVIAQIPFTSGISIASQNSIKDILKMSLAGIKDLLAALFKMEPYYYPIAAKENERAILNTKECFDGYLPLFSAKSAWKNHTPARIALAFPFYNPIMKAPKVECPVLVLSACEDSLIPENLVRKMVKKIKICEYHILPSNHFQPYTPPFFEENIFFQIQFLKKFIEE